MKKVVAANRLAAHHSAGIAPDTVTRTVEFPGAPDSSPFATGECRLA